MFRLRKNHRDSARNLLLEVPVEAVRYAGEHGCDLWPIWLNRRNNSYAWENAKRGAIVGCALTGLQKGLASIFNRRSNT